LDSLRGGFASKLSGVHRAGSSPGVDGIYINDNEGTIDVFQSKISQRPGRSIGDAALKEFHGTLSQFENSSAIQNLIDSGGDADVVKLVKRLDLINKMMIMI
jgi:hypothetical protein